MILRTNKMLFVTDSETSDKHIEHLLTEYNTESYMVSIDRTMSSPYYTLFRVWKEGKRMLNDRLFATSKIDKLVKYVNDNL